MMTDPILYWNAVALEANRVSHTSAPEQTGPTLSSRAQAIVHLAMHDAYFAVNPAAHGLYLPGAVALPAGANAEAAVSGAACAALAALFPAQTAAFEAALAVYAYPDSGASVSRDYGIATAKAILAKLAIRPGEPGADDAHYKPSAAPGRHREDPANPGQGFHAPYYGATAPWVAVSQAFTLDTPPAPGSADYAAALAEVIAKGGAAGQVGLTRTPDETIAGLYWAYDGAAQLGTPPRLYNQIVRVIAAAKGNTVAQNARLFALVNAAMGDAGVFAWSEKYRYDVWRPVLGVREHDASTGPSAAPGAMVAPPADPFWLPLGAPRTNTARPAFTPPFPAYPSGHATFGAAAFQMVRRFYGFTGQTPDDIAFEFVSGELDGVSTGEGGVTRTRHRRHFDSLWRAIYENGLSRVFLGVHWVFDAFAAQDVTQADGAAKAPADITYTRNIGGVPLGLKIADDIFDRGLKLGQRPTASMMPAVHVCNGAARW